MASLYGLIFLHLRQGRLSTRSQFGVASYLAVQILHGALFIDCFIYGISPSKQKVVLWHSHPVAILAHKQNPQDTCISNISFYNPAQTVNQNIHHDAAYDVVRVAR